jgi:hypothetical protein
MAKQKATVYTFKTTLKTITGGLISTAIFLPPEIVKVLPEKRLRAKGTFNGAPFDLAIQFRKDGKRFFTVSGIVRKAAKIKAGDAVDVTFSLVNPDKLVLPEELEAVLAQDDEAMEIWKSFTPGYQRSLTLYITSVKNVDSRINRSFQLVNKMKTRQLSVQQKKK